MKGLLESRGMRRSSAEGPFCVWVSLGGLQGSLG